MKDNIRKLLYVIPENFDGKYLKDYLSSLGFSQELLKHLKKTLNMDMFHILKAGEEIHIDIIEDEKSDIEPNDKLEYKIIYEDEDMLVINNPADMPIHPSQGNHLNTLGNAVVAHYIGKNFVYRPITRLDRDTSGVCLIAKNKFSASIFSDAINKNLIKRTYKNSPIIIGGIEASLRRLAHYDYWQDLVRKSILLDSKADLLVYGMGEKAIIEAAKRLRDGKDLRGIPNTCHTVTVAEFKSGKIKGTVLPAYPDVKDKQTFAAFWKTFSESDGTLIQPHPKTVIVQNPEAEPLTTEELDRIYELPFTRKQHPAIKEPVPALAPVQFSLITHRGCFGACSFCSITHHQGKRIISRSEASILREARRMAKMPEFKGTISDVGGPSANMYGCTCRNWETKGPCRNKSCIGCPQLQSGIKQQLHLLKALREIPKVKHVFIGSGIRYDLIPEDEEGDLYLKTIAAHHISGHLKVAPEHIVPKVTKMMNKPDVTVFDRFRKRFESLQQEKTQDNTNGKGKRQYLVPYLMSSHPGCRIEDMVTLALYLREHNMYTEQVQDFTPSPMTLSTAIYYTGLDPRTGNKVYVPLGNEKRIQRAVLQWRDPKQYDYVVSGLLKAGRKDLIGDLVPDRGIPDRERTHPKQTRRR